MADEVRLYGPDGRPVRKRDLTREAGRPTLAGVRQTWRHESVASGLTPQRLAAILRTADDGEGRQRDYLTLAEEMEERDPHYAAVLGVRKRAVSGLEPAVEAVTDDAGDVELADAVRELVREPAFGELLDDCLDALGKGFSAVEIIWARGAQWRPARYERRDPRFFTFDREDGRTLRLLDEADSFRGLDLAPYKWITHVPRLKSGLPMRGGLARLVAIAYMVKAYAITDWTAFAEVFGMPLRLGRYGPNATEAEIAKLIQAVANLGTDAAAAIPDSMRIEFVEAGNRQGGADLFERLAVYLDKQVSKAVLGATMTADDGSSLSQAQVHDEVRGDILRSDARQLADTLNRDLVRPFIDLNYGPRDRGEYPRLCLPVPEPEDIKTLAESLEKLVPLGLRVEGSVIRDKLNLPDPEDGAEVLGAPDLLSALLAGANRRRAVNRAARRGDPYERALEAALEAAESPERAGEISRELVEPVLALAGEPPDVILGRLAELRPGESSARLQELLARMLFAASLWGSASVDDDA